MLTIRTDFTVADAMTKSPITVSRDISVMECAQLMKKEDIGSVVIVENGSLIGIVTEWDIVRKVVASGKAPAETKVGNIMCTDVQTIDPNVNLFEAISTMAELNIRHLPVVHQGEFVGFLTSKDVLKIEPALFDIMVQSFEVREKDGKPIYSDDESEKNYGNSDDDEED